MNDTTSRNIRWETGLVSRERREKILGQNGCVMWLTGFSGSGKSTLAKALEERLTELGRVTYVLDGDNLRHGLCSDLGFAPADRHENIRRAGEVAALMADAGLIVVTAFISPYRAERDYARSLLPPGRFFEAHLATSLEVCEGRDPKGLYRKARSGVIPEFTGISAPYEIPDAPEVIIDTDGVPVPQAVDTMIHALTKAGILSRHAS